MIVSYKLEVMFKLIAIFLALRIGFRLPQYTASEPNQQAVFDSVSLIKEDNRQTERTFGVIISFGDPGAGTRPATLQGSADQTTKFDYLIQDPGNNHFFDVFYPFVREIHFPFLLEPDELPEGTEGIGATIASEGGQYPNFQLPVPSPEHVIPAYPYTLIEILDNDSKLMLFLCDHVHYQFVLSLIKSNSCDCWF